jgi:hypothetical protein
MRFKDDGTIFFYLYYLLPDQLCYILLHSLNISTNFKLFPFKWYQEYAYPCIRSWARFQQVILGENGKKGRILKGIIKVMPCLISRQLFMKSDALVLSVNSERSHTHNRKPPLEELRYTKGRWRVRGTGRILDNVELSFLTFEIIQKIYPSSLSSLVVYH